MEFRRRAVVRIDRLLSRAAGTVPGTFKDPLAADLDSAFGRVSGKLEFMRFMDSFQRRLYERLRRAYADEPFCQLLTLKLCNLAIARYHFVSRHTVLLSRPYQLTVDPTNACQLGCPGCVHTTNREYAAQFDWPRSTLPHPVFERFLEETGAYAFCVFLYNYGEPLLHRRFGDFVRSAKRYLQFTLASTNLSMPLQDPESLVTCGLDRLVLSIDGATPAVYEKYRRKGQFGLVLDNLRSLVASKKRLGSPTPYLSWQFLTFEHNVHEVERAAEMAREIGVNEIMIVTPFGVELDDPGIRPVKAPGRGTRTFVPWDGHWCSADRRRAVSALARGIEKLFDRSWEQRFHDTPGSAEETRRASSPCDWLYSNLTLDGAARVLPCCMAPDKADKHLVFANFTGEDPVNSPMATLARLAFTDRAAFHRQAADVAPAAIPFCASCTEKPGPYGLVNVEADIRALDARLVVPRSLRWRLTKWS